MVLRLVKFRRLGCWQFGGDFGEMAEKTSLSVLRSAMESGIDFFDTADVYGGGLSETLIGRFLKKCPHPVTVARLSLGGREMCFQTTTPWRTCAVVSRDR